jgi:protein-tyrosine-phosphatase
MMKLLAICLQNGISSKPASNLVETIYRDPFRVVNDSAGVRSEVETTHSNRDCGTATVVKKANVSQSPARWRIMPQAAETDRARRFAELPVLFLVDIMRPIRRTPTDGSR